MPEGCDPEPEEREVREADRGAGVPLHRLLHRDFGDADVRAGGDPVEARVPDQLPVLGHFVHDLPAVEHTAFGVLAGVHEHDRGVQLLLLHFGREHEEPGNGLSESPNPLGRCFAGPAGAEDREGDEQHDQHDAGQREHRPDPVLLHDGDRLRADHHEGTAVDDPAELTGGDPAGQEHAHP